MSPVSRETQALLARFEVLVADENQRQNLVSSASLSDFAVRHCDDGAQLVDLAPPGASWCDIGSGAGLPGVIVAILTRGPVTLVEPRRLRADFLRRVVADLALANVTVVEDRAERVTGDYDIITARAVAEVGKLFALAEHLAHPRTRWILPKGRNAKKELDAAKQAWQGEFRLVPSRTSDEGQILVAERVRRKGKR